MSRYFFRHIVITLKNRWQESVMTILIITLSAAAIMASLLLSDGSQAEKLLAESIPVYCEFKNGYLFSSQYDDMNNTRISVWVFLRNPEARDYYFHLLDSCTELGKDPVVTAYSCETVITAASVMDEFSGYSEYQLFGVGSDIFWKRRGLELSEGRYLNDEEMKTSCNKMIVASSFRVWNEQGNSREVSVGDTVRVYFYQNILSREAYEDFEIVGKYRHVSMYDGEYGQDMFLNSQGCIISQAKAREIVSSFETMLGTYLNNIAYYAENYDGFQILRNRIQKFINEETGNAARQGCPSLNLGLKKTSLDELMDSFSKTGSFYKTAFTIVFALLTVVLISYVVYNFSNRFREMFICYSLGRSWGGILAQYVLSYCLLTVFALVIGIPLGILLAYMFNNCFLFRALSTSNMEIPESARLSLFSNKTFTAAGITAGVCLTIVIISVTVTVALVIRKQIRNVL